ncbi:MAG TPA: HTTM domain-containing protein, partial [Nitriliruptorales bacterium]
MTAWEHYWFGPVAAIRPYLLMKAVYGMLALDLWLVQIPRGGRYGAGGFNVAHFRWLDVVQPLPSPDLYVGLMLSLGLLALVCALSDPGRWARALVAVLHTYSWAMSLHDTYQHHYFLSLALAAFVFFPRVPARALAAPGDAGGSTVSAWAYALLGTNVGLVYAFTALAKLDPTWRTGEILRLAPHTFLAPLAGWAQGVGIPPSLFWRASALAVVALESVVAVGYLVATRRDDPGRPWVRMVTWLSF